MPQTHLVTEDKLEQTVEEAKEDGRDPDAIRDMYVTPEDAIGRVFKKMLHWGHTYYEAVGVDREGEEVVFEELFTGKEFREDFGTILNTPFIGDECTVSWVEAKIDGEWERVSEYATPDSWQNPTPPRGENYEQTRVVEKTYKHGSEQFDSWPIRIEHQSGEPEVAINGEGVQNDDVLEQVLESIELPDSFDLSGIQVGTIYTDKHIVEDGERKHTEYEVVWWSIKNQFKPSRRDRISPVTTLDRKVTV